jgi:DNA-directed RNA polymerase subunit alpha
MSLLALKPTTNLQEQTETTGTFVIEPLMPGFGQTIGNAMRRVLLSHLTGAAITKVRIDGVSHEFSAIPGVKEDVVQLILAIKQIRFAMHTDEPQTVTLDAKGPGIVKAGDLKITAGVSIANPDFEIASLTDAKTKLSMELTVERGQGYRVAPTDSMAIGVIGLDARFSPVTRVNYVVEDTRVGQNTNLDKLIVNITTDGSVSAQDAMSQASAILVEAFGYMDGKAAVEAAANVVAERSAEVGAAVSSGANGKVDDATPLEELGIPTRVLNSLKKAEIETVGDLRSHDREELLQIKNLGEKSLDEVLKKIG